MVPHREDPQLDSITKEQNLVEDLTSQNGRLADGHKSNGIYHDVDEEEQPLDRTSAENPYDLLCVGFGPANLAFAVALQDALETNPSLKRPRIRFFERQKRFQWHSGMLLPGARMQITFLKDLATMRNPRSKFTFLNYLHHKDRLASFTNLDTFLPQRIEYEDYMKWCASHFNDMVQYEHEVVSIRKPHSKNGMKPPYLDSFEVDVRNLSSRYDSNNVSTIFAKKVLIAAGGKPSIPPSLSTPNDRIIHSSQYITSVQDRFPDTSKAYTFAVLGGGQSAAEIFHDLHSRYPFSNTRLIIKGTALRPSDDSPFVNEIFDPQRVGQFYDKQPSERSKSLEEDKTTNYGVVRLTLLEALYEDLYMQKVSTPDPTDWQHKILTQRIISHANTHDTGLRLFLQRPDSISKFSDREETLDVDAVFVGTGYSRSIHEDILKPLEHFRPQNIPQDGKWPISRDFKVVFDETKVGQDVGIWLSGCNESTHGLSDTLLSTLATRGGELVRSMFGADYSAASSTITSRQ